MAVKYTEEQLNPMDKSLLITMFLGLQEQFETLSDKLTTMDNRMQLMMEQLILSKQELYGWSSEKLTDHGQICFMEADGEIIFFNEAEAVSDLDAPEPKIWSSQRRRGKNTGKKEDDLSGLTTHVSPHYMTEQDLIREFGEKGWKQLPDVVTKRYKFVPAKIEVEEHHIGVYASKKDGHMKKAEHPNALLHGSLVSASLAAAVMNGKYVNAVPLYRLEDGRPAGSKSYMWVYRTGFMYSNRQIVLYEYQKTRNASHPKAFLKGYTGICVTDGYQVYHTLEKENEELTIAGCWVHARRRFDEVLKTIPESGRKKSMSYLIMKQIQAIYREEGKLKGLSCEERLKQRQVIIEPLVDAMFAYLRLHDHEVPANGKLREGFTYALNQERYLKVFLTDGNVPIDNNASERAIRGFCIGKKNWQVIDTINGAASSAIIYSIAETAKANNLKPYDYFEYLLTELPKHTDELDRSFLEDLLPWSEKLPEHIRKPKK